MIGEAPFTLGMRILSVEGLSESAFVCRFDSVYGSDYLYQIYLGRTLAGVTEGPLDRHVVAQYIPSVYPEHVQLLAVDPSDRNTDFGASLPSRPYNRVKLTFDTTGFASSTRLIEIAAGTEPEGAVDEENVILTDQFRGEGEFVLITDPLGPGGEWNFEIAGRDQTRPEGNRGTALELAATIKAHPPDLEPLGDGSRFEVEAEAGTLTISYELPEFE